MSNQNKLGTKAIWLFGLATLAVAILVTLLLPKITGPLPLKAMVRPKVSTCCGFGAFTTRLSVHPDASRRYRNTAPCLLNGGVLGGSGAFDTPEPPLEFVWSPIASRVPLRFKASATPQLG